MPQIQRGGGVERVLYPQAGGRGWRLQNLWLEEKGRACALLLSPKAGSKEDMGKQGRG